MATNIAVLLEKMAAQNTAKQMNWQTNMSNTAHQREVKDLKAAGLNPILSSGGSGAPAYTTSVDSAVNAIGGIEQSRISSNAAVRAAKMNAAAMKAAAYASAAAQKYAADRHYAATQYSSDLGYKTQGEINKANIEIATINSKAKINSSAAGLVNKYFGNNMSGLTSVFGSPAVKAAQKLFKGTSFGKLFKSPTTATSKNFELSAIGRNLITTSLGRFGVAPTGYNVKLFAKAFILGNKSAQRKFMTLSPARKSANRYLYH